MEYVYGALLLHKAGQKVDGPAIVKVLEAAGVKADVARANAMAAALDGVNIEEAIKQAPVAVAAATAPAAGEGKKEDKKEEKKSEEDKAKGEEEAASGLAALFA